MRRRTNAGNSHTRLMLVLILSALLLLTGCGSSAGSNGADRNRFTEIPTFVPDPEALQTPTPVEESQVVIPGFIEQLLAPGPTLDAAERVYFRNGRDFWTFSGGEAEEILPQGTRFGAYATSPHGQRAAVVIISEVDDRPVEAVHIIANGVLGPAVTPERFTSGPDAQSSIHSLVWSRDATRIAIVYDEPTVAILEIAREDGGPPQIVNEITLPEGYRRIQRVDWAITGGGMAILAESPSGVGSLWMASLGGELHEVKEATLGDRRSISDIAWLPGRGRIAFVEERSRMSPIVGGSMFTITPDGSGRELLVSSGNFAPAAEIGKISASPGGNSIAFTVNAPNAQGELTFHSAWIVNIDSGATTQIPLSPHIRVTDFWWMTDGLLWRAVHQSADVDESSSSYAGVEPFAIGRFDHDAGTSQVFFQSTGD